MLKLCSIKNKSGAVESRLSLLKQHLADVCASQEKEAIDWQAKKEVVAAKKTAEMQNVAFMEELSKVENFYAQAYFAGNAEDYARKVLLVSAEKRMDDAEFDGNNLFLSYSASYTFFSALMSTFKAVSSGTRWRCLKCESRLQHWVLHLS